MGSFLSEGEVECKVGYTVDIQFTLNKDDWFFDTLEAVSTADAAESRQDYVQFTLNEKKSDKSKGIYVITVKLLKPAGDILIKPKCLPLPYVTSYTPNTKNAQFANTPVVINFNIPIEDSETSADESLINYDNILLTFDKPGDMKDYFFPPELNEDKTVLKLVPKGGKLKEFISVDREASFVDITISLSDRIIVKNGEQEFPLRQDSNSTFTVRFGTESEETPPDERAFFVSGYEIPLATAADFDGDKKIVLNKLCQELKKNSANPECIKNMTPANFYIYGKYYDKDSGVRTIEVSEKYQYEYDTNLFYNYNTFKNAITTSYDIDSDNVVYQSENGYTSFVLKYTLQATLIEAVGGGYFDMTVTIKDACDNPSESKTFCVLCMEYGNLKNLFAIDKSKSTSNQTWGKPTIKLTNTAFSKVQEGETFKGYDFSKYNEEIKKIVIMDDDDDKYPSYFQINGSYGIKILCKDVDYVCEYIDKRGTKRREAFTAYDSQTRKRYLTLDLDSVNGKSFTVIPLYKDIPLGRKTYNFPPAPVMTDVETNYLIMHYDNSSPYKCVGICQYPDGIYKIIVDATGYINQANFSNTPDNPDDKVYYKLYLGYINVDDSDHQIPDKDYYLYGSYYKEKAHDQTNLNTSGNPTSYYYDIGLVGEMIGPFEYNQSACPCPAPTNTSYSITRSNTKGYINIVFKWDLDLWDKYDSLYIRDTYQSSNPEIRITPENTYDDGEHICFSMSERITKFYSYYENPKRLINSSRSYVVYGVKNNVRSSTSPADEDKKTILITQAEAEVADNLEPEALVFDDIFIGGEDKYYAKLSFYDFGSGPESGELWINGNSKKYEMSAADGVRCFEAKIPLSAFKAGSNTVTYVLKDKAGNTRESYLTFNSKLRIRFLTSDYVSVSNSKLTVTHYSYVGPWNKSTIKNGLKVFKLGSNGGWSQVTIEDSYIKDSKTEVPLESGYFYRVCYTTQASEGPYYFNKIYYAGTLNGSGSNYLLANGISNDSVVICSKDEKVLMSVYRVSDTIEECKEWNAVQWEMMCTSRTADEEITVPENTNTVYSLVFNGNSTYANEYYCIVAHFANGDMVAGPVMHR